MDQELILATGDSSSLFRDSGLGDRWLSQIFHISDTANGAAGLLGQMLQVYNLGILAVATLLLLLMLVTMVMESAQYGRVGGERHSPLWAMLRLILAIGLLTPIADGYSGVQVAAIQLAHAGSGLANTVWAKFAPVQLEGQFKPATVTGENPNRFLQQVLIDETCLAGVALSRKLPGGQAYGSVTAQAIYRDAANTSRETQGDRIPLSLNGAQDGIEYLTIPQVILNEAGQQQRPIGRFRIHYNRLGNDDYCGAVEVPAPVLSGTIAGDDAALYLQAFLKIRHVVANYANNIVAKVDAVVSAPQPELPTPTPTRAPSVVLDQALETLPPLPGAAAPPAKNGEKVASLPELPQMELDAAAWNSFAEQFAADLAAAAQKIGQDYIGPEQHSAAGDDNGWGEAGFVFFKVARLSHDNLKAQNYSFSALLPSDLILPETMRSNGAPAACVPLLKSLFKPDYHCLPEGQETTLALKVADNVLNSVNVQNGDDPLAVNDAANGASRHQNQLVLELSRRGHLDSFLDTVSGRGGAGAIMPIIGAINAGNELLRSASVYLRDSSEIGGNGSNSLILIIFAGLSYGVGVFLAYCLPLFPLIRFFSGILSWLLILLEALVALPLVALVNLRGDGEGLFSYSEQGLLLLLQMVLRPVLMIIGLIVGLTIFDVLYEFINQEIWGSFFGVSGGGMQAIAGGLDSILAFYACLLLWVFLVYSLANLAFGMINSVPNRILVWIGERKVQVAPSKPPEDRQLVRSEAYNGPGIGPGPAATAALQGAAVPSASTLPGTATMFPTSQNRLTDKSAGPDPAVTKGKNAGHIPKPRL